MACRVSISSKSISWLCMLSCFTFLGLQSCASGGGHGGGHGSGRGGESSSASSDPLSPRETTEYAKALLRCHKTGGTRIVKIEGNLRCF